MKKRLLSIIALVLILILGSSMTVEAAKEKFHTWQDVARAMGKVFDLAIEDVEKDDLKAAYKDMDTAYFRYYETQGFESNVGNVISGKRVAHIEGQFRDIKHTMAGYQEFDKKSLIEQITNLKYKVFRDAMVLDGVADKDSPDEVGKAIDGNENFAVNENTVWWKSFTVSFGLLLREGLEAILVVVAIVTYLVKTGNKHLCKGVYLGVLAAVIFSFIIAGLLNLIVGGSGTSQELMEGLTMFIAVGVLFYVSNWMLHKSDEAAWEEYINAQVRSSVDKQSYRALIFASFIAVAREGAELVLFYQASLTGGQTNKVAALIGFVIGCLVLLVIWIIFRYSTVKIPLKPFFMFTSILLFLMCISFVGKGVQELTEAGIISGATTIPLMNGFSIPDLGIFDRAETVIPQLILIIASVWMIISHKVETKRRIKAHKKEANAN